MSDPMRAIEAVLVDPGKYLGNVERNVETKLIGPVLELLGWDLVTDVLWGQSVRRSVATGRTVVEADALVVDLELNSLRFVVEAKRWGRALDQKARQQVSDYLTDLGGSRGLLTNGS